MENVKITILIKNKKTLLANANICMETVSFGRLTIKGMQIWQSNSYNQRLNASVNITPPTRNAYGKYFPVVFFENPEMWFVLEKIIYEMYCKKQTEEEVNIDDIPELSNSNS